MKNNEKENEAKSISLLSGLGKFIDLMGEMIENDVDELSVKGIINNNSNNKVMSMYGINIKLGRGNDSNLQDDINRIISDNSSNRALIEAPSNEDIPEEQRSGLIEADETEVKDF